jgi:hypothetical protein
MASPYPCNLFSYNTILKIQVFTGFVGGFLKAGGLGGAAEAKVSQYNEIHDLI